MIVTLQELKQRFLTGDKPSAKDFDDLIDTMVSQQNTLAAGAVNLVNLAGGQTPNMFLRTNGFGTFFLGPVVVAINPGDGIDVSTDITGTTVGIADVGVTGSKIAAGVVTADKLKSRADASSSNSPSGSVPIANGSGGVAWGTLESLTIASRFVGRVYNWDSSENTTAVPLAAGTTITIPNTQALLPISYEVMLHCITTDSPFAVGDEIPADQVSSSDSVFAPAITLKVNTAEFVLATAANFYVGATSLTPASWNVIVRAVFKAVSASSANTYQLHGVRAAVPYGDRIYAAHTMYTLQTPIYNSGHDLKAYGWSSGSRAQVASLLSSINPSNCNVVLNKVASAFPTTDLTGGSTTPGRNNTFGMAQMNVVRWPTANVDKLMWIRGNATSFQMNRDGGLGYGSAAPVAPGPGAGPALTSGPGGSESSPAAIPYATKINAVTLTSTPTLNSALTITVPSTVIPPTNVFGTPISSDYYDYNKFPQHLAIIQVDDSGADPKFYYIGSQLVPIPFHPSNRSYQMMLHNCAIGYLTSTGGNYTFVSPAAQTSGGKVSLAGSVNFLMSQGLSARLADVWSNASSGSDGMSLTYTPVYLCMVRYNPIKQQFYVIDSQTGLLHIFTLHESVTLLTWVTSAALDYTKLTYTGSYVIPVPAADVIGNTSEGVSAAWYMPSQHDHWTVEFDTTTGQEISLCGTLGEKNLIVRIPWLFS